jgi:hypothetical protein
LKSSESYRDASAHSRWKAFEADGNPTEIADFLEEQFQAVYGAGLRKGCKTAIE